MVGLNLQPAAKIFHSRFDASVSVILHCHVSDPATKYIWPAVVCNLLTTLNNSRGRRKRNQPETDKLAHEKNIPPSWRLIFKQNILYNNLILGLGANK
jgi:hypothetical protein